MYEDSFFAISPDAVLKQPHEFPRLTSAQLDSADYQIDYLVDGVLVKNESCVAGGPPKSLKTTIAGVDLSISLASKTPFLDRFQVRRACTVAVMSAESGLGVLQETARRICRTRELELAKLDNLIWSPVVPRFGDAQHLVALDRFLQRDAIEVLILDPFYQCMSGSDAGNLFSVGDRLRDVNLLCQGLGVTLILLHHTKKSGTRPNKPLELEHLAWSGTPEFARQWLLLSRRQRYVPGTGEHRLWMSVGGSAGHSGLFAVDIDEGGREGEPRRWAVAVHSAEEAHEEKTEQRKKKTLEGLMEKLIEAARQQPGKTLSELRELTKLSGGSARKALDNLVERGVLRLETMKKGKKECEVIFLAA